jgi:hypothetical protein
MEKDIGKVSKNDQTEIVIRIDDFGGNRGLTIREFVTSDRYTGFTKAGVRIKAEDFPKFKEMINSISEQEMSEQPEAKPGQETLDKSSDSKKDSKEEMPDY